MGTSTDAILLYGIPLSEETDLAYDEEGDPEEGPAWLNFMGNEEGGIVLVEHCSNEAPMYFVAVARTVIRAHRGHPKDLTGGSGGLEEDRDWELKLYAFCEKYTLKPGGKAGWYLASMWS